MSLPRFFLPLLVLSIAGLSIWLLGTQKEQPKEARRAMQTNPDAYMEGVVSRVMDKEGRLRYELHTPRMVHYPLDDRTEIDRPHLTLFRPDERNWQVDAENATALRGDEEIQLHGEVWIRRAGDAQSPPLDIRTRELFVYPEQEFAKTREQAILTSPNGELRSQGMQAYFEEEKLQLLSQVRGRYEVH
jgi:lipopolysaccharide export system protein LptC